MPRSLALWSLAGAPLILGADLTHLTPRRPDLLENRAVFAVDQDRAAADRVLDAGRDQVFAKIGPNGTWFIAIFNTGTASRRTFRIPLSQLGSTARSGSPTCGPAVPPEP